MKSHAKLIGLFALLIPVVALAGSWWNGDWKYRKEIDFDLSPAGDLVEAASHLFSYLRALDAGGPARIAVAPIPTHGLGAAINDRLRRAAAPRKG